MSILIVGNVLKDVYLNLDTRTEKFEVDKNGTKWLDLGFNASEHHFFSRMSSFGGAAVSLEVLRKIGVDAEIAEFPSNGEDELGFSRPAQVYRYILTIDGQLSYLAPSEFALTEFRQPDEEYDYLFIDRSATLDKKTTARILDYLAENRQTKLVVYVNGLEDKNVLQLMERAELIFYEGDENEFKERFFLKGPSEKITHLSKMDVVSKFLLSNENTDEILPEQVVFVDENHLGYLNLTEEIKTQRAELATHLSLYSILAATVLGCFLRGKTVEESFRLARLNAENARLDMSLSLEKLEKLARNMPETDDLELIAKNLVLYPKGILAADESGGSIKKKFAQLNIEDTYENRRDYRNIFFTTPNLEDYVNGVILFEETTKQRADDGRNFVEFLTARRIIPGIKVDQGLEKFENSEETYTKGLDGLEKRMIGYYNMGLRFAKWRAAFEIRLGEDGQILTPTDRAIEENTRILADYAKVVQDAGLVPIVEPEVVYDGDYPIEDSASVTGKILDALFVKLAERKVNLKACILKVNMILAGKRFERQSTPEEIGEETARVLEEHVPEELAGVVFLSGGQTPEQATKNLSAIEKNGPFPWPVTFSFARALQDPALYAWNGDNENADAAREAFLMRLIANCSVLERL